ncbi:MAG: hypothetical protein ACKVT0_21165 [Planctomycetaceae bacterium]
MHNRVTEILTEVDEAQQEPGAYDLLPEIRDVLAAMLDDVNLPEKNRVGLSAALGRIVLERTGFSDTPLGEKLLKLADDFGDNNCRVPRLG